MFGQSGGRANQNLKEGRRGKSLGKETQNIYRKKKKVIFPGDPGRHNNWGPPQKKPLEKERAIAKGGGGETMF